MSGFDVRQPQPARRRALTFISTLSVALLLVAGVMIHRTGGDSTAEAASPAAEDAVIAADGSPVTAEDMTALATAETVIEPENLALAEHAAFMALCEDCARIEERTVTVRRGQTFASVLSDAGADRVAAARAIAALDPLFSARSLRAGQSLTLYFDTNAMIETEGEDGALILERGERFDGFSFRPDAERTFTVARTASGQFRARQAEAAFETEIVRAKGEVESNLYLAALEAGATDRIIFRMAEVLGYAIDFRAIQYGDAFDVVFEREVTRGGDIARTGEIVYLSFDGRGDPLEYFRFENEEGEVGFFTAEGESARRLLMKVPINGARLSGQFGMRFHPILNTARPHNGTDFAAPRGTPIMAAGTGVVERANRFGSFGNYLRIRHANGYKTVYAHLNGFARGVRAGSRVQQGQIVAYVGTTGRSTGPHLHYEVHLNGRPINPMSLNLPEGRKLDESELPLFEAERDRILALRDGAPSASGEPFDAPEALIAEAEDGET